MFLGYTLSGTILFNGSDMFAIGVVHIHDKFDAPSFYIDMVFVRLEKESICEYTVLFGGRLALIFDTINFL